jgi:hypothetical protein
MGAMKGREMMSIQRGMMDESDVLEMVATRCLSHDFEIGSLLDLDYWIIAAILEAWSDAMKATSLPPTNGTS